MKGDLPVPLCTNSCCEGQGTRLLGSLPEYIYSVAPDGLYVNLFEPSSIAGSNPAHKLKAEMTGNFPMHPDVALMITLETHAGQDPDPRARMGLRPHADCNQRENGRHRQSRQLRHSRPHLAIGDTISFTLPIALKLTRYTGLDKIEGHERFALEYGPMLLALSRFQQRRAEATRRQVATKISCSTSSRIRTARLHFNIEGNPQFTFIPYWQVITEPFTCFPVIDLA